jgi:hypothetical protein
MIHPPAAIAQQDDNEIFLDLFYKHYFKSRMDYGFGDDDPEAYFRLDKTLIEGNQGIISVRTSLAFLSTGVDRLVGLILAVPTSPGKINQALSVIGTVSEARGILDDLGLFDVGSAESWFYDAMSFMGLLNAAWDSREALEVVKGISSFDDLYRIGIGGLKASDARKLTNFKMFGLALADFILDKTLVAQVRTTLKMDRLKKLLLATRAVQAAELERLYRKAKYKTLTWFEAFRLMQLEAQYFARKAECYHLDALYWQEQLNPTVGRLPFSESTFMDLLPGYDDPEQERQNLGFAQSAAQNAEWHMAQCVEFFDVTIRQFDSRISSTSRDEQPGDFTTTGSPVSFPVVSRPFNASYSFTFEMPGDKFSLSLDHLVQLAIPGSEKTDMDTSPFIECHKRYSDAWLVRVPASEQVIKDNISSPYFGHDSSNNRYVYLHLLKSASGQVDTSDPDIYRRLGFWYVDIAVLAVARANLDADPDTEFVLVIYNDEEELPTHGRPLDRHSIVVLDAAGATYDGVDFRRYKQPFYADTFDKLELLDYDGDGRASIVVRYTVGSSVLTAQYSYSEGAFTGRQ